MFENIIWSFKKRMRKHSRKHKSLSDFFNLNRYLIKIVYNLFQFNIVNKKQ